MLPNPVDNIDPHVGSLVTKCLLHIFKDILKRNAMPELSESVKGFLNHLSPFLSEFANNVEELCSCS